MTRVSFPDRPDPAADQPDLSDPDLLAWVERKRVDRSDPLGSGYQGDAFLYDAVSPPMVVKFATGSGLALSGRRKMLRHERRAYRRLEGVPCLPRCYGLIDGQHLALSYVDGVPYRDAEIVDREAFFAELLSTLRAMHERGVAHSDLKKKDNLLVIDGRHPCVIDLGAAVLRSKGFGPLNHYLFNLSRTFDLNAFIKLKYQNDLSSVSEADRALYNRTRAEKLARWIKDRYQSLTS